MVLLTERMVLKIEQILGSKNSIQILRHLVLRPYLSFGLTDLSNELNISKSNILRINKNLVKNRLILELNKKRKKTYRINPSHNLNKKLFEVFMIEKQGNLNPKSKNIVDLVFAQIKEKVELFIIFGSVAYNKETADSDIDVCIVGDKKIGGLNLDYQRKVEIHNHAQSDFLNLNDFVVIESLINGIWYKGDMFDLLSKIESIPKPYMIHRLNQAKVFLKKAESLKSEARIYFFELAKTTLGEIHSILRNKTTILKRKIGVKIDEKLVENIEKMLSKEGERIWIN